MIKSKINILIICFTDLARDPRVYRQILFLKDVYHVTVAGLGDPGINGADFIHIDSALQKFVPRQIRKFRQIIRQFEKAYWTLPVVQRAYALLRNQPADLIIANDLTTLPISVEIAKNINAKLLFDAHEFEPRQFEDRWMFNLIYKKYFDYLCRSYLRKTDGMMTVGQNIADEYRKVYGVDCDVLTNAPFYQNQTSNPVSDNQIRLIHHGGISPSRKIENMIYLMDQLEDRFTLDLMLIDKKGRYLQKLKSLAKHIPRIKFVNPVPMPDIASTINKYDIGLYPLVPASFNQRMALPNKIFEFIQARLAVAIWPSPEMARIVNDYDCGVVSENFTIESLAEKMNKLSEVDIMRFKNNAHQAARELSAENNKRILLKIIQDILNDGHA